MSLVTDFTIHTVTDETPELLDLLLDLFVSIFPSDTRYVRHFQECARIARQGHPRKIYHLWLFSSGENYVGFRVFSYLRRFNLGYSAYVGFLPAYRHHGFGRLCQGKTLAQIVKDAVAEGKPRPLGLCQELSNPRTAITAAEKQEKIERLTIFEHMGVIPLDVDYLEPPAVQGMQLNNPDDLLGVDPRLAVLVLAPIQPILSVDPETTAELVKAVYTECYDLDENDWYVQRALRSIHTNPKEKIKR